ncbi:MAG TPA: CotH kinase family protein [Clostridia bacterium]
MYKLFKVLAASMCLIVSMTCINPLGINAADSVTRPDGWTDESHGKKANPNYSLLFPDDKVNRIDIIISQQNYNSMESNVKTLNMMSTTDPIYVPATVKFNNLTWTNVGVRYKGASTLFTPLQSQKHKLPLHLSFDKFEDQYPEIKDQRFYGFKEVKLGNNWYDPTFVRDKVTSDIFRSAGIPTAHGAFYRLYVDIGSGPAYWGLYTMFEDPSDKMLKTQFANKDGNLYKGLSATGADLTTFNKQGYEKKTNKDADDWSDLQALVTALNAPRTDAAKWRTNLEKVFDVNLFLRWLAINTAITNFDTYGWVTKNHYLYQDLANNGRMVYIPWDFNLSLSDDPFGMMGMGGMGGFGGFGGLGGSTIPASLSLNEIGSSWPLIRYLMDDPVYKNIYHYEMKAAMSGCFDEAAVSAKIRQFQELIRPYTVGTDGEKSGYSFLTNGTTQYNQGFTDLLNLVTKRHTAVNSYLSTITITATPTPSYTPTPTPSVTKGDVNGDGKVNSADYAAVKRHILNTALLSGTQYISADVNGDGVVNSTDYSLIKRYILTLVSVFPSK